MRRASMIGAALATLAVAGCAAPQPQYTDLYAYPPDYGPGGGAMTSPAPTGMQPIPDTPENRARYGGPQSRAGKRSPYERR